MSKIAIVYWSGTGNTEAMADLVAQGVRAKGSDADLINAMDFGPERLDEYDAYAFGCPAMGAEELEETEFAPMFDAVKGSLSGKDAALFGSYGWGDGEWMRNWEERAKNDGATLVGGEGLIVNETPDDEALEKCAALGAELVKE